MFARLPLQPRKFITMRWRMTWAKIKSANALSGLIPANWDLLAGLTWTEIKWFICQQDEVLLGSNCMTLILML